MDIKTQLKKIKSNFLNDGIEIVGFFGSFATNKNDEYSDIDIAYKINYDLFFQKYQDGFSQILKLQEIKENLQTIFHKKVDFVPLNDKIEKELINV
jgi:predicted nucleotidyltransferase